MRACKKKKILEIIIFQVVLETRNLENSVAQGSEAF
jgi:hypothetical protein